MKSSVVSLVFISILFNTNPTECQFNLWPGSQGPAAALATAPDPKSQLFPVPNPFLSQATNDAPNAGTTGTGNPDPNKEATINKPMDMMFQFSQKASTMVKDSAKQFMNVLDFDIMKLDIANLTQLVPFYDGYRKLFHKRYANRKEKDERMDIFKISVQFIQDHNRDITAKYLKGINELSDMTFDEVSHQMLGLLQDGLEDAYHDAAPVPQAASASVTPVDSAPVQSVASAPVPEVASARVRRQADNTPDEWDWRKFGIITPPRHQWKCGSCWSFAAACALESHNMKRLIAEGKFDPKNQLRVSEQNLIDCSKDYGTTGCKGAITAYTVGMPQQAFRYVAANKGINTADAYRYTGKEDQECAYKENNKLEIDVKAEKRLKSGQDADLVNAIYTYGPIAIAVHVTKNFLAYKTGLFDDPKCNPNSVNHAVAVVGYTPEHFIIRNSWGPKWGEDGYIRIARSKLNNCGVSQQAWYPLVPNAVDTQAMRDRLTEIPDNIVPKTDPIYDTGDDELRDYGE